MELMHILHMANETESAFNNGDFAKSTQLWSATEDLIESVSELLLSITTILIIFSLL